jgi:hypothetical protein
MDNLSPDYSSPCTIRLERPCILLSLGKALQPPSSRNRWDISTFFQTKYCSLIVYVVSEWVTMANWSGGYQGTLTREPTNVGAYSPSGYDSLLRQSRQGPTPYLKCKYLTMSKDWGSRCCTLGKSLSDFFLNRCHDFHLVGVIMRVVHKSCLSWLISIPIYPV